MSTNASLHLYLPPWVPYGYDVGPKGRFQGVAQIGRLHTIRVTLSIRGPRAAFKLLTVHSLWQASVFASIAADANEVVHLTRLRPVSKRPELPVNNGMVVRRGAASRSRLNRSRRFSGCGKRDGLSRQLRVRLVCRVLRSTRFSKFRRLCSRAPAGEINY